MNHEPWNIGQRPENDFIRCIRTQSWEETTFGVGIYFWSPHSDFPGNCVSDWKVSKMILGLRQLSFHKRRFSWIETKTVSLNEYQIKRQSTKNATESTVSLGEKYWPRAAILPVSWKFRNRWCSVSCVQKNLVMLRNRLWVITYDRKKLYFAPTYQFFSFHFGFFEVTRSFCGVSEWF